MRGRLYDACNGVHSEDTKLEMSLTLCASAVGTCSSPKASEGLRLSGTMEAFTSCNAMSIMQRTAPGIAALFVASKGLSRNSS